MPLRPRADAQSADAPGDNPLLEEWSQGLALPPFARIRPGHFAPAYAVAMRAHLDELDAIAAQTSAPTFDNTLVPFDASGALYERIDAVFHNLASSATSPEMQAVERDLAAALAAHRNAVYMHAGLFARLDVLHANRERLGLDPQQRRLLERVHLDYTRAGARLPAAVQARYGQVMQRLAQLCTRFAQNVLADETDFLLVLRTAADRAGLPDAVIAAARQAALERGVCGGPAAQDGPVVAITLSRSLIVPFLTYSTRRDLREQAWRAWTSRGEHDGAHDNRPVASEILALRLEQARAHGHAHYAEYALADTMAGSVAAVRALLEQVWHPAKARAAAELRDLQAMALAHGEPSAVEPWDWRYLAERVRARRYAVDDAEIKPYFALERVAAAAFDCARRLFGVQFVARPDLASYHADARVYEVRGADGGAIGLYLQDNFARAGKRSGAWMSHLRWQCRPDAGTPSLPVILNNNNFAQAAPGEPTLLSLDDARTLFHEFGHGLHGLLSSVRFRRLSGTQVLRDFVELPSQLYEHWLNEPQVLERHARHIVTDAPMPAALAERLRAAALFDQGCDTVRYTASALVDLAVHASTDTGLDITAFERQELERLGAPPACGQNHRLPHFQHLFSGASYAAGYYVYLWAEVLDADAFEAFEEAGDPFDAATAERLRRCIYGAGNAIEPGAAYRAFRGRDPQVEPMLRGRGLLETQGV